MFYLIYKTTNIKNGKIYIGAHKTSNIDDGYMGSGRHLNLAIKKYGIENFIKEILFKFDNKDDMYAKEHEIVNEEFVSRKDTYNIKIGGSGGFDYINNNPQKFLTEKRLKSLMSQKEANQIRAEKFKTNLEFKEKILVHMKMMKEISQQNNPNGTFFNKNHTDTTKEKMSVSHIGKHDGNKNSQYGTMWITNGITSKKINKNDSIPKGWNKGRILNLHR